MTHPLETLSIYDAPDLYGLMFDRFEFDLPFWKQVAHAAGGPLLESEMPIPGTDHKLQLWDGRVKNVVGQLQHSTNEYREVDANGSIVRRHVGMSVQRWVYRFELELLLRVAGFARWELFGGFEGEPLERPDQQMIVWGWTA